MKNTIIISLSKDHLAFLRDFVKWLPGILKDSGTKLFITLDDRFILSTIAEYIAIVFNIGITFNYTGYVIYKLSVYLQPDKSLEDAILINKKYKELNKNYINVFKEAILEAVKYIDNPF